MRWALAILLVSLSATASADPPPIEQPDVVPRATVVVRPFRAYADPTLPPEQTGLRDVSLGEVASAAARSFADARFASVDFVARALDVERSEAQQDLVFIAQQSARLGAEHYRAYNLASAASELEAALDTYSRTLRPWTHPEEVGDVLLNLALVELELGSVDPDSAPNHEARAREALRTLARIDPTRSIDRRIYPPRVVSAWHRAYLGHFVDGGASLRMRADEAEDLAAVLDADQLVWAFTMTDGDGTSVVLQVYDGVEGRFDHDDVFVVPDTQEAVGDELERRISATVACQGIVVAPAEDEPESDEGAVYLDVAFSSGTYIDRPTDRLFYNRGIRVSASWMIRETFGLFLSGAQWTARRDPDGELLAVLNTSRVTGGVLAGGRMGRLRLYGVGGLDVTRVGRLKATDDFWCKVSGGDPFQFDDTRQCTEADVTNADPQTQLGFMVGLGAAVRIVGPFWLHTMASSIVTVAPFEDRTVGAPLSVDVGVSYRF